jgi:hypothetical protein
MAAMSELKGGLLYAPFTEDQVKSLAAFQADPWMHPFTCRDNHAGDRVLKIGMTGWTCAACDYAQDWCHPWMADWSWRR